MLKTRRTSTTVAFLFTLLALTLQVSAAPQMKEIRSHWRLVSDHGDTMFTVSQIQQLSEDEDHTIYLVTDGQSRWQIDMIQSYWQQKSIKEFRDLESKAFVRMQYGYPYKSKTRSATIAEAKSSAAKMDFDPEVTFAASAASRTAHESEWKVEDNARKWRAELRKGLDSGLLEGIEKMRGTVFSAEPQLRVICDQLVSRFLYGEACDRQPHGRVETLMPDCFFDSDFHQTCSTVQKNRADVAHRSGNMTQYY
jgi:hypothetical protein